MAQNKSVQKDPQIANKPRLFVMYLIILILAAIPYLNSLSNGFALDDNDLVKDNPKIRDISQIREIFSSTYWGEVQPTSEPEQYMETVEQYTDMYRPVTTLSYAIDYVFWRDQPFGYHLTNILLHALTSLALFIFLLRLVQHVTPALIGTILFAVHPVHTEVVCNVVGRAEILATLFFLLGFIVFEKQSNPVNMPAAPPSTSRYWFFIMPVSFLYFLALLSKESAVTLPFVLLSFQFLHNKFSIANSSGKGEHRKNLLIYSALFLVLALYLLIRGAVLHAVTTKTIWAGFIGVSNGQRILTALRVLSDYVLLLFFPVRLSADYWGSALPIIRTLLDPALLLALFVLGLIGLAAWFAWKKKLWAVVFGIAWFFMIIMPMSNVFFPIGVGKAERLLYLPSAGLAIIAAGLLVRVRSKKVYLALGCVLLLFAIRTAVRNQDWRDDLTLAEATLKISPESPAMLDIVANSWIKKGNPEKAIPFLEEAVRQLPLKTSFSISLGNAYYNNGNMDSAERVLREALERDPNSVDAASNLAATLLNQGKTLEAEKMYKKIILQKPDFLPAYINLGAVYANRNDWRGALDMFLEGLKRFPDDETLKYNAEVAKEELGKRAP